MARRRPGHAPTIRSSRSRAGRRRSPPSENEARPIELFSLRGRLARRSAGAEARPGALRRGSRPRWTRHRRARGCSRSTSSSPSCRPRSVPRPGSAGSTSAPAETRSPAASSSAACSSSSASPHSPGSAPERPPPGRRSTMARGSIIKRRSGNYAIVYYVDGKQKMGDDRPEPPRRRTRPHGPQARGRHRHLARAEQRDARLLRRAVARASRSRSRRRRRTDTALARDVRELPALPAEARAPSPRRRALSLAPHRGRRSPHRRARGRRQGARDGPKRRRSPAQDARGCRAPGSDPREPGRASRPAARPGLRRQGDPARRTRRRSGRRSLELAPIDPLRHEAGSLLRLFLRCRAGHRPSPRRAACSPLGRCRPRRGC